MENSEIEDIMKDQKPTDCCLLIYTVSWREGEGEKAATVQ